MSRVARKLAPWPEGVEDVLLAVERNGRDIALHIQQQALAALNSEYGKWERHTRTLGKRRAAGVRALRARNWAALVRWARRENARTAKERS